MSVYTQAVTRIGGLGSSHEIVLGLVPPGSVVLDVGCASGYLAGALYQRGAKAVDGLEFDPIEGEAARAHCRRVEIGSVEDPATVEALSDGAYDVIVCADVIEHLADPSAALANLLSKLKPDGTFVISVPNVAHYSVRLALLRGRFRYEDLGLLDRTHLRFFTHETLLELLDGLGLRVGHDEFTYRPFRVEAALSLVPLLRNVRERYLTKLVAHRRGLLAYQFVLSASRRP